jgi:hypothetical protein
MESFKDYCKDYILDHIEDYEGQSVYGCDFGYTITEEANVNGSLTFSTYDAKEYLRAWFDECGEYWEYEELNFGEHLHNPFGEPEAYMVGMVIVGVSAILANAPHIEENWNDEFELTSEVIEDIKEYVKCFDGEIF